MNDRERDELYARIIPAINYVAQIVDLATWIYRGHQGKEGAE